MSPNRQPRWLSKEPVRTANVEFQEALANDPFIGEVAQAALANFIKATNEARGTLGRPVSAEDATEQIITRITEARDVATSAEDDTYAQIFDAQRQGWEAASRTMQASQEAPKAPTSTAKKQMSGGKSNRT